jgi:hypothetical protein
MLREIPGIKEPCGSCPAGASVRTSALDPAARGPFTTQAAYDSAAAASAQRREMDRREGETFAAACAVADAWAAGQIRDCCDSWPEAASETLDMLERLTRGSPLRKVRP